ncbi:amidohydrolase family protein [Agrobacterium salinitolerans]|uniref:Amidohydrolase family protein n=2 Tax=Agrobacterium salinitolerans TaxID=1183413 RepID=A0A9X3R1V6_9HYPH|nr:amidohydrolase family protein [Agrobacterium salinitolerans]MCZ7854973.1 amidohydrolase family protein [Agrobacterium salinitolerans]MCZ7894780.1 amidohydrolase family protein [Agrobacterium salinitolerans]MCZ7940687.1 amidohydrolase family protein [Agrobacterium salinitolerans]
MTLLAPLGWHIQLHAMADQIAAYAPLLKRLPCQIVFDHFARLPAKGGLEHPAYEVVCDMLAEKRAWIKLSAPYLVSHGSSADLQVASLGSALVHNSPERVVWGSDWPHMTEASKPEFQRLKDMVNPMAQGDTTLLRQIFISNPNALYGFR